MVDFYRRLKEAMSIRKITQSELCAKTGIPKSAMSQYLSGAFKPKQTRTYLIAEALNVSEAWLLGYDVPMTRITSENGGGYAGMNYRLNELSDEDQSSKDISQEQEEKTINKSERKLLLLARHLEKIPEEKRQTLISNFEDTIDMYLDALGINKED